MNKSQKQNLVAQIEGILSDNPFVVLINYKGIDAGEMATFRKALKSKGANARVTKNTLSRIALRNKNLEELEEFFLDQIAICYSEDPISLSKILVDFAKDVPALDVKAGYFEGKVIDINTIKGLSALGSLDDVRAKFVGLLRAPHSQLVRVLDAYRTKLESASE